MTTIYTFPVIYTKLGIAAVPSPAPTIQIVDKDNNILVAAGTAVTAISNMAGAYYYAYSGADDLICWALFHTTDESVDQMDIGVYTPAQIHTINRNVATLVATDPWDAPIRTLTQTAASIAAAINGTTITILRGDTLSVSLTGLGSLANYFSLYFTVKNHYGDLDTEALLMIKKNLSGVDDGLIYINGESGAAAHGSITIDDNALGNITITLAAEEVAKLWVGTFPYDVQIVRSAGIPVSTLTVGVFAVPGDYTRAVA